jgi:hypothetical protein
MIVLKSAEYPRWMLHEAITGQSLPLFFQASKCVDVNSGSGQALIGSDHEPAPCEIVA